MNIPFGGIGANFGTDATSAMVAAVQQQQQSFMAAILGKKGESSQAKDPVGAIIRQQMAFYSQALSSLQAMGMQYAPGATSGDAGSTAASAKNGEIPTAGSGTLADAAKKTANEMDTSGKCFKGVRLALESVGIKGIGGASAYMAADQLAKHEGFKEVKISASDLKNLPAGAIVVWDRTAGKPHGHVSIALGGGKEASDHIQSQITNYGSQHRVFLPSKGLDTSTYA